MKEMTPEQHQQIIDQLQGLNDKIARQNDWVHIFATALVYGVGFVIGSTILATIILGFALPAIKNYFGVDLSHLHPQTIQSTSSNSQY